jgi:integrase
MAPKRIANQLKPLDVNRLPVGMHLDGLGLYLQVTDGGRSWIFRFTSPVTGRVRDMGLGAVHTIALAKARQMATDARAQVLEGVDPIEAREASRAKAKLDAAKSITFEQAAEAYIASNEAAWSSPKQAPQWRASLQAYAYPLLKELPVHGIDTDLVTRVLRPIWNKKPETASRLRGRIERILGSAIALGQRSGPNPARLTDNLDTVLGKQANKKLRVKHHAALPYAEIGGFMELLKAQEGVGALALRFTILTAARTSEVTGLKWSELDLDEKIWTVPGARIKARREHRVPLTPEALAILEEMKTLKTGDNDFVFPGESKSGGLSNGVFLALLKRIDREDITAHGFRSTFRDWAAEQTNFANFIAEAALAHAIPDATEAAYRRGELLDKRRKLMEAWARYCSTPITKGQVVSLNRARR